MRPGSAGQMASSTKSVNYVSQMAITSTIGNHHYIATSRNMSLYRDIRIRNEETIHTDAQNDAPYDAQKRPKTTKNETTPKTTPHTTPKSDQKRPKTKRRPKRRPRTSRLPLTCSHIDDGSNGSLARISRRLNGALVRISTTAQASASASASASTSLRSAQSERVNLSPALLSTHERVSAHDSRRSFALISKLVAQSR